MLLCACKTLIHLDGMVLPELICWMEDSPAFKSSSSPESSSLSTSLEAHAASSGGRENENFVSASSEFSSPGTETSTPGNQSIDCSPTNEQKESLEFPSEYERKHWKTERIRVFNEALVDVDPRGNIGFLPNKEIVEALNLDSHFLTQQDMEHLFRDLWTKPWPSNEEADRTSVYARVWALLDKDRRPSI